MLFADTICVMSGGGSKWLGGFSSLLPFTVACVCKEETVWSGAKTYASHKGGAMRSGR